MFAQTWGCTLLGLNGILIRIEVDISSGLPGFELVGLPDAAVRESKERVRAAIKNSGFKFPGQRITINLAPADLKKDSSGLDLPIAIAILAASGYVTDRCCQEYLFTGELSLDGQLRRINGILPMAIQCVASGILQMVVAPDNSDEALLMAGLTVYAPVTLRDLVAHLSGQALLAPAKPCFDDTGQLPGSEDFADVQGQLSAKRALEIAAAGGHNVLMIGPPGSGKTMLARRIASILPAMSWQEALEVTQIYSVAGLLKAAAGLVRNRPFRNPHHTISSAGMIGGGSIPRPGEVTLSHNGILFLDELPEFPRLALEVLRQPLEDGQVTISRVNAVVSFPANVSLVCSMNPCPCGFRSDLLTSCTCSPRDIRRYVKKISGPLLDRIDIHVHVPRLDYGEMNSQQPAESSADIRRRVAAARRRQSERLKHCNLFCNAQMGRRQLQTFCRLDSKARELLQQAFVKLSLSPRGHDRLLKVARTIADLENTDEITACHVAEAIHYRQQQLE